MGSRTRFKSARFCDLFLKLVSLGSSVWLFFFSFQLGVPWFGVGTVETLTNG